MASTKEARLNFNRGLLSPKALGRADLERTALSAEVMTNWMPRVLGNMMLRPGWEYVGATKSNAAAKLVPFVFASDDRALLELTDSVMRVRVDDALVTRPSVTSAITNGSFGTDLTGWTDADEAGATSAWATGGYMGLQGNGYALAIRRQQVTTVETNTLHALRIVIARGPVTVRIGSSSGGDEYINETSLGTGTHSLAFTPTGNFYIQFQSRRSYSVLVDSVSIESSGAFEIPTPWTASELPYLRGAQSADVIFVASSSIQPYRVARRTADSYSWSIEKYEPEDGPFRADNTSKVTLTPSDVNGDITLTASAAIFRSTHVGSLFAIDSVGQYVEQSLTGANQFSSYIRVTGTETSRQFTVTLTGTWSATVTLQRSVGEPGAWVDVVEYTGNGTTTYDDNLDNQTIYYRIGIKTGDYTSGTANAALEFSGGTLTGVVRITAYTNGTTVSASVIRDLGETNASEIWRESVWSDYRGHPSAVALYEGRLWWMGQNWIVGSISDAYESFDPDYEGDAGPIVRTIGEGPVDYIAWALPLQRLVIGTFGAEMSAKSTSFDEPLTPSTFSLKKFSTQGSAPHAAVDVDYEGFFVQRGDQRVYQLVYDAQAFNYASVDATAIVPELCAAGVKTLAAQRQPDTRVHCVLDDGTVAILVFDRAEEVKCWVKVETDGDVEDVAILPCADTGEDEVYYIVKRTIDGSTVRYVEKWALESECVGGTLNKQADAFYHYSGVSTTTITGLDHLEGEEVVVWAAGADQGTFTVASGSITLGSAVTSAIVGLAYTADFKSSKLGKDISKLNRVHHLTLLLADTHAQGLQYGPNSTYLDDLPLIEEGTTVDEDHVWDYYTGDAVTFNGTFDQDARIYLRAAAPRPACVMGLIAEYE